MAKSVVFNDSQVAAAAEQSIDKLSIVIVVVIVIVIVIVIAVVGRALHLKSWFGVITLQ